MNPLGDLERYRLPPPPISHSKKQESTRKHRMKGWFLKGPIPGHWLELASKLPGKALHVGMAVWYQAGFENGPEVIVSSRTRRKFNLTKDSYRRGLIKLESAGLVTIQQRPGQCARITLMKMAGQTNGEISETKNEK